MTNQAILQPKEDDRYLAVVVPKGSSHFKLYHNTVRYKTVVSKHIVINPVSDKYYLDEIGEIIGLLSNITEEQTKEIVFYHPVSNGYKVYNESKAAKDSLQSLIESSGLTYNSEQDVLLIKIN